MSPLWGGLSVVMVSVLGRLDQTPIPAGAYLIASLQRREDYRIKTLSSVSRVQATSPIGSQLTCKNGTFLVR